jgi:hypothetical protein
MLEPHTVMTSVQLKQLGIIPQDIQKYLASGWISSVGRGAFKRPNETVTWQGALYSVQSQLKLSAHVGALTALEMTGQAHYLRLAQNTAYLFSPPATPLPHWFRQNWGVGIRHVQTGLLPADLGLTTQNSSEGFKLITSAVERAILEMLHLANKDFDLMEIALIIEGMTTLRPKLMQSLLEACGSIKVTRLFLYFAERANLPVMRHLDTGRFDLGSGDRSLASNGRYVSKYKLLLPKELVENVS